MRGILQHLADSQPDFRAADHPICTVVGLSELDSAAAHNEAVILRVRAFVFLAKGDRASGVAGTRQVLPDTGEISRVRCSGSSRTHGPVNFGTA
jgi:hypothetical protein